MLQNLLKHLGKSVSCICKLVDMLVSLVHIYIYVCVCVCVCVINKSNEVVRKPHTDSYREVMNDWNYDDTCALMPLWSLGNFKHFVFIAQSVPSLDAG